jgi:hypothetical protein
LLTLEQSQNTVTIRIVQMSVRQVNHAGSVSNEVAIVLSERSARLVKTTVEYVRSCERCGIRSSVLIYDEVTFKGLCCQCQEELEKRRASLPFAARPAP